MTKQDIINEMTKEEMADRIIALQCHIKDLEQEQIAEMSEHLKVLKVAKTTIDRLNANNRSLKMIVKDLNSKLEKSGN